MNKRKNVLRTDDKNALLIVGVLVGMLILIAVFYHGVRYIPLSWLAIGIMLVELLFIMPSVCQLYYKLYNANIGILRFIPLYNALKVFPGFISMAVLVCLGVIVVTGLIAFGPAMFVTNSNAVFIMNLSYNAVGIILIECAIFSILLGIGYTVVVRDVRQMRNELTHAKVSAMEIIYLVFVYVPFLRAFALLNLYSSMTMLLSNGYHVGMDLSSVEISEEYYDGSDEI